jgi:hypothetical protein
MEVIARIHFWLSKSKVFKGKKAKKNKQGKGQ